MKSMTLFISMIWIAGCCQAQINKGAVMIGGDMGFSSGNQSSNIPANNVKQKGVILLPAIGTAIRPNLIVGLYGLYSYKKYDVQANENDYEQQLLGSGVFGRKYKRIGKSDFAIIFQAKSGVEFEELVTGAGTAGSGELNTFKIVADIYPGISYGISKKLQLEMGFSNLLYFYYYHGKGTRGTLGSENYTTEGFYFFTNLENVGQFYLGLRLLFNK